MLARLGRPEVSNCIDGLEQYSHSYEEQGDAANQMRQLYHQAIAGEFEFNHMASVAPKVISSPVVVDQAMIVDESNLRAVSF